MNAFSIYSAVLLLYCAFELGLCGKIDLSTGLKEERQLATDHGKFIDGFWKSGDGIT